MTSFLYNNQVTPPEVGYPGSFTSYLDTIGIVLRHRLGIGSPRDNRATVGSFYPVRLVSNVLVAAGLNLRLECLNYVWLFII